MTPNSSYAPNLDPGAIFRIDPNAIRSRLETEREGLMAESRRAARKLAAYEKLIAAMWELRELGEADFLA